MPLIRVAARVEIIRLKRVRVAAAPTRPEQSFVGMFVRDASSCVCASTDFLAFVRFFLAAMFCLSSPGVKPEL